MSGRGLLPEQLVVADGGANHGRLGLKMVGIRVGGYHRHDASTMPVPGVLKVFSRASTRTCKVRGVESRGMRLCPRPAHPPRRPQAAPQRLLMQGERSPEKMW